MEGFAIIKVESGSGPEDGNLVSQFNDYMQSASGSPSFVRGNEGYFRLSYGDGTGALSAGIAALGNFLQSNGYAINGMGTATTGDGQEGTEISFLAKDGGEGKVILSTVRVY